MSTTDYSLRLIWIVLLTGLTVQRSPFSLLKKGLEYSEERERLCLEETDKNIIPAANRLLKYQSFVQNKHLGLVVNHTSVVGASHLVDTLLKVGCKIQKIFAPEHGFRGKADAGKPIPSKVDKKTGIPIISAYGKNKKLKQEELAGIDLMIFDIQDVGARFYTYTSTMTYVMEACAKAGIPLLILDRPNPTGHYVDGPILETDQRSFVGLHPVPIVHGLTVAEYARMINGEGWLENGLACELYYVRCLNYNHKKFYELPRKPSPNLPNIQSIYLYPSLCLFEGTNVSVGRGTKRPFQLYGHPDFKKGNCTFTPISRVGARHPLHQGKLCRGYDLTGLTKEELQAKTQLNLEYLIDFYKNLNREQKAAFFRSNDFFSRLAGNSSLQEQIRKGVRAKDIRATWQVGLSAYKEIRKRYLLYEDFE